MIKKIINKLKLKPFPSYQFAYLVILMVFFHMINFQYDNDFWFTINQGRYVLEHSFPTFAINSIHQLDFIYQSWGTGVLFYLIYKYLGLYGMVFLLIGISSLTMYFFYKLCYLISNNKRSSLILTIITYFLYATFVVTRPHIFTVLNLTIMLYLLESYIKKDNVKYLYPLPIISLLEVNMHGVYFIILLVIMVPYLINSFKFNILNIKSSGYHKKPLFIAFLCMGLMGFINPYGYKTIIYGFLSYGSSSLLNNSILELLALDFHSITSKVYICVIITTFVLHFMNIKKMPLRYTLLLLGTSYLAFDAYKSVYFFLFCSLFPLVLLFKNKNNDIDNSYSKKYHITHLIITIVACIGMVFLIHEPKDVRIKPLVDYLDETVKEKESLKIFTDYTDGSYAEYRGYNCYIDPRGEVFLKANNHHFDVFDEYDKLTNLEINYKDFIDKYLFDYMIVNTKTEIGYLMKYDSYKYEKIMEVNDRALYKLKK